VYVRLAYADPPYPGKSHLYPENTEVDHAELVAQLCEYDGWALSTWEPALRDVLALCPPGTRVLAWCRSNEPPFHARPYRAWEPVLMQPARLTGEPVPSYFVAGAPTGFLQREGLTGQKPATFCEWVIRCLGADRDDSLVDVFPGTGIMGETWARWTAQLALPMRETKRRPAHARNELAASHVARFA
jgi:hypothetical protein